MCFRCTASIPLVPCAMQRDENSNEKRVPKEREGER